MNRLIYLTLCLCLYSSTLLAQDDLHLTRMVVLPDGDLEIKATILNKSYFLIPNEEVTYYCFHNNKLDAIQGSYTGFLLSGRYEVFSQEQQLLEQGFLRLGLRHGRWKYWHLNGKLKQIEYWVEGKLHGKFTEFNEEGILARTANYKRGKLHGLVKTINNEEVTDIVYYRNGEEKEGILQKWLPEVKKEGQKKKAPTNKKKKPKTPNGKKNKKPKKKNKNKKNDSQSDNTESEYYVQPVVQPLPPKIILPTPKNKSDAHKHLYSRRFSF